MIKSTKTQVEPNHFPDNSFEVVACYELLEHLQYENFYKALSEIFRVSKSYAILSLPDAGRFCRIYLQIPKIGTFKRLISLPRFKYPMHNLIASITGK